MQPSLISGSGSGDGSGFGSGYGSGDGDGDARKNLEHLVANRELLRAELEKTTAERDALRELIHSYNLGGWTDAVAPMQRALAAEAERDALKSQLAAPVTEAEIRARNDGCVELGKGIALRKP